MSLLKPLAEYIPSFDATNNNIFRFTTNGGTQVVKNRLTIRNNTTNTIVYQNTIESYTFQQELPSNTLINGTYYNFYFNTYDVSGNMSEDSNSVQFWCYTTPTLTLNINNGDIVNSSSYNFSVIYNQQQGELLQELIFKLYNENNVLLSTSNVFYSSQTPPTTFNYSFNGFENNKIYKIQVNGTTVENTQIESSLISFSTNYIQTNIYSILSLTNDCDNGYVRINSNLIVANGEMIPSSLEEEYIDNRYLDVHWFNNGVKWYEGFNFSKDFILSCWLKPTQEVGKFVEIRGYNLTENDGIHLYVNLKRNIPYGETTAKDYVELKVVNSTNSTLVSIRSNYVDIMNNLTYMFVWFKKVGNVYQLILTPMSRENTVFKWNGGGSTIQYNIFNDLKYQNIEYTTETTQFIPIENDFNISTYENQVVTLYGGIYDNLDITSDTTREYNTSFPIWNYKTILDCDFNSNINGGNTDIILSQIDKISIKRRLTNSFDWITLYEIPINSISDFNIVKLDSGVPTNESFDYAFVPVASDGTEGTYIVSSVTTLFNGLFISDNEKTFKLYNGIVYSGTQSTTLNGILQPIGRKYPFIIENSDVEYEEGSIQGTLVGYNFENTRKVDRFDVNKQLQDFVNFMNNKKSKIVKDWNGKIVLVKKNGSVSQSIDVSTGVCNVAFNYIEQGKYDNEQDLINNGII